MKKKNKGIIRCMCGHLDREHIDYRDLGWGDHCLGIGPMEGECKCVLFKMDNLSYLQEKHLQNKP